MTKRWLLLFFLLSIFSISVQAATKFTISDIRLEGLERIPDGTLLNYLPVRVGDVMDSKKTAYAIEQLYKTGFFKDVKLARDGNVLVVQVVERPAIAEVKFSGNNDIDDEQLESVLKEIGIVQGRVFNPSNLDKIELGLKQQAYYSQGKYAVRIKTKIIELEQNRVSIEIEISEGVVARIKQVNIVGNQVFEDSTLLSEMQLGVPGGWNIFSSIDEYAKPKLAADLESIKSYYQDRGYIKFQIESTQVTITPDKKDIYITINVNEGDQYRVNEVKLLGNFVVEKSQLELLLLSRKGQLFSMQKMTEGKNLLTRKLGNEGYAFARVKVFPDVKEEQKLVDISYMIDPGKKVYVRRINFSGNYKTRDEVLRRELRLMEGAELSNSKLERSKIRLQRLPFVEEVSIDKAPVAGTDDMVDININISERLSGSFNIGAGYSQQQGFVFNLGLQMENLIGTGKKLGINFSNDKANTLYSVSFTNPYYTVDGVSRALSFVYRKRDAEQQDINNFLENTFGATISYGIPLSEYDRIRLGFGLERTEILSGLSENTSAEVRDFLNEYGDSDAPVDELGNKTEASFDALTLIASYSHDTRNRTVFANKGSQHVVSLDMTAPHSELEFYKLSYRSKVYFNLTSDLTFMFRTDLGYGDGYNDNDSLPLYTRYYAGGLRTVRGFENNSLGPRDDLSNDPRGGDIRTVAGAELIFPVPFIEKPPSSVRFSAFYDIGNVFLQDRGNDRPDEQGFDSDELRSAIGFSFVWLAPIGPLQFSWSRAIETKDIDETESFQFSIGSFF